MALNRIAGDRGEWLVILEDHEDGVEAMEAEMSPEPNDYSEEGSGGGLRGNPSLCEGNATCASPNFLCQCNSGYFIPNGSITDCRGGDASKEEGDLCQFSTSATSPLDVVPV